MTIAQWSTLLAVGQAGFVAVALASPEPIVVLDVVYRAGGAKGAPVPELGTRIVATDLRDVQRIAFRVPRAGVFGLELRVLDVRGCQASSAHLVRNVIVR